MLNRVNALLTLLVYQIYNAKIPEFYRLFFLDLRAIFFFSFPIRKETNTERILPNCNALHFQSVVIEKWKFLREVMII